MKKILLLSASLCTITIFSQVGVRTANPQQPFHVDGNKDNPVTGQPSSAQEANDVVINKDGHVGIGTLSPDASSALEIRSGKGFLPPRVDLQSETDAVTISTPANGLMVYNKGTNIEAGLYSNTGTPASPYWSKGKIVDENQGNVIYKTPIQPLSNEPILKAGDFEFQVLASKDIYIRYTKGSSRDYNAFITENWVTPTQNYSVSAQSGNATNGFTKIAGSSNIGSNYELNIIRIYDVISKRVYRYEVNLIETGGVVYISQIAEVF